MKRELKPCRVLKNQLITPDCVVCGNENPSSLHAQFCDLEDGRTLCIFETHQEFQSFPDRLHGGMIGMIMDELLNRTAMFEHPGYAGVTMELNIRYRTPVPLNTQVMAVGWMTRDRARVFDASAEVVLPDGTVAVEASARCLRVRPEDVGAGSYDEVFIEDPRPFPEVVML